jgi:hypothetical protein
MRFDLGSIYATPGALELLERNGQTALTLLARHARGDWGTVPDEDARENEFAVRCGLRILSSYRLAGGRLWIITEADRSSTTLLLPSEY